MGYILYIYMYVGRRYSSPRVIDLQLDQCIPMNESTPEPHDPPPPVLPCK
jgi:hypothetical protein